MKDCKKNCCGQDLSGQNISCRRIKPKVTYRNPPDYKLTCQDEADLKRSIFWPIQMKDLLSQPSRRNGLPKYKVPRKQN